MKHESTGNRGAFAAARLARPGAWWTGAERITDATGISIGPMSEEDHALVRELGIDRFAPTT